MQEALVVYPASLVLFATCVYVVVTLFASLQAAATPCFSQAHIWYIRLIDAFSPPDSSLRSCIDMSCYEMRGGGLEGNADGFNGDNGACGLSA
jgi:hypothetical protein